MTTHNRRTITILLHLISPLICLSSFKYFMLDEDHLVSVGVAPLWLIPIGVGGRFDGSPNGATAPGLCVLREDMISEDDILGKATVSGELIDGNSAVHSGIHHSVSAVSGEVRQLQRHSSGVEIRVQRKNIVDLFPVQLLAGWFSITT